MKHFIPRLALSCAVAALSFAALHTASAHAQDIGVAQGEYFGPILPWRGLYSDPAQGGSGLSVDIGPSGHMFLTFGTFDRNGNQENLIAQPVYQPNSNRERHETGVIGTATASFYRALDGQYPGGPHRNPVIEDADLTAQFTWFAPRHVEMTFKGVTYDFRGTHMEPGKPDSDANFIPGRYAMQGLMDNNRQGASYFRAAQFVVVDVTPASFGHDRLDVEAGASGLPPASAKLFMLRCAPLDFRDTQTSAEVCTWAISGMLNTNAAQGFHSETMGLLWFDEASNTAGMEPMKPTSGQSGRWTIRRSRASHDVYVTPDVLHTRSHLIETGRPAGARDGDLALALTLTKLPQAPEPFTHYLELPRSN